MTPLVGIDMVGRYSANSAVLEADVINVYVCGLFRIVGPGDRSTMDQSAPFEEEVLEARIVDIEMTSAVPSHRRMGSAGEGRREGTGAEEKDADMDAVRKPSMVSSDQAVR